MSEPEFGWSLLQQTLEDERNFYATVNSPYGALLDHAWLPGYDNEDRGFAVVDDIYRTAKANFGRLLEITSSAVDVIPAMSSELDAMEKIEKELLEPTHLIIEGVPSYVQERGKPMLSHEEYAKISYNLSSFGIYLDYRNGLNRIRRQHFIEDRRMRDLLADMYFGHKYKAALLAFQRKKKFFIGNPEEFGFITFCAVDSHDGTLLPEVLEADDPTELLLNYTPERGINRVVFPEREETEAKMREILANRSQKENMCTVSSLRMRLSLKELEEYTRKIMRLSGTDNSIHPRYIS